MVELGPEYPRRCIHQLYLVLEDERVIVGLSRGRPPILLSLVIRSAHDCGDTDVIRHSLESSSYLLSNGLEFQSSLNSRFKNSLAEVKCAQNDLLILPLEPGLTSIPGGMSQQDSFVVTQNSVRTVVDEIARLVVSKDAPMRSSNIRSSSRLILPSSFRSCMCRRCSSAPMLWII